MPIPCRDRVDARLAKISGPRHGISLVAGNPFPETVRKAFKALRVSVDSAYPNAVVWPEDRSLHATILRGKSSRRPIHIAASPPDCPKLPFGPFPLVWNGARLGADGAIRGYVRCPSHIARDSFAAEMNHYMVRLQPDYHLRAQDHHWITLGSLTSTALDDRALLGDLEELFGRASLPNILIDSLSLVLYHDITFNDTHTPKECLLNRLGT